MSQTQQEVYLGGNVVEPSPAFQVLQNIKEGTVPSNKKLVESMLEMEKTLGGHAENKKGVEGRFAFDAQRLVRHARQILEEKNQDDTFRTTMEHVKDASDLLAQSTPHALEKAPVHVEALAKHNSSQLQLLVDSFKNLCIALGRNANFRVQLIEALQLLEQMLSDLTEKAFNIEEKIEKHEEGSSTSSSGTANFQLPSQTPFKVYLAEVLREEETPDSALEKKKNQEDAQKRKEKLQGILVELGTTPEYKDLINNLSNFFKTNWQFISSLFDEAAVDNKTLTALLVVVGDVQALLERFSGNKPLNALRARLGVLLVTLSRDQQIREFFGKWRDFLLNTIQKPEEQNAETLDNEFKNLMESGKEILKRKQLQEDIGFVLKETKDLIERLRDETAFKTVGQDLDQMRKELLLNDEGKLDLMTLRNAIPTLKNVLIPTLTATLKTIPIPTITVDNEKYFLQLSNLSLDARDFVPEKIRIHFTNDILFDFMNEGKDMFISRLTVLTRDFQALLRDLNFKYERKKMPKISDFGVADVEIVGVDIDIRWKMDMIGSNLWFYVDYIKCEINNVHTDVKEAHHKLLDNIYVRMFNSGLRKSVEQSIESTLREKLFQFSIDTTAPLSEQIALPL